MSIKVCIDQSAVMSREYFHILKEGIERDSLNTASLSVVCTTAIVDRIIYFTFLPQKHPNNSNTYDCKNVYQFQKNT